MEAFASDFTKGVAVAVLLPLAVSLFVVGLKLLRVYWRDRSEYIRNQERSPSLDAVVRGEVPTFFDGIRDERVTAGLAIDTKNNTWVEQGKLSEEAVSSVLH
jgi:hypothetical protein